MVGVYFSILGFRMAAECARNALLQKVMDNKADAGMPVASCSICFLVSLAFLLIHWLAQGSLFPHFYFRICSVHTECMNDSDDW